MAGENGESLKNKVCPQRDISSGFKKVTHGLSADIAEDLKGGQEGENKEGKGNKQKSGSRYGYSDNPVDDFIAAIHYM